MLNSFRHKQKASKPPLLFSCMLLIALLLNCNGGLSPKFYYSYDKEAKPINQEQVEKLKEEIQKFYKAPYKWGGNSVYGTDCSGFISSIFYNALGIVVPHNAAELYLYCIPIKNSQLRFGDLVFFGRKAGSPNHVGLYVDKNYFLDATNDKGVALNYLKSKYYKRQLMGAGRLIIY